MLADPPIARIIPHETRHHDDVHIDHYFWLRDRNDSNVLAYLEAENAYVEAALADTKALQEQLYAEMRGRIKETDLSVPEQRDDYFYYSRMAEGKQYPLFCRKHGSLDAAEEVLLDQNELAEGQAYCRIGAYKVSPNHQLLAYSVDITGAETYTLHVKDLASRHVLPDQVPNTYYGLEWANDNQTLFYTLLDGAMRPYKAFRHTLGTPVEQDVLVHHETDEAFFVEIAKTRSQRFLLINLESATTSEVRYTPADQPTVPFEPIQPRQHELEYAVEHHGERWLIVTNDQAKNFKLVEAPLASPGKTYWRDVVAHRPDVKLDAVDAFERHIVVYERAQGLQQIWISDSDGNNVRYVSFPEPVYMFRPGTNPEFGSSVLRFTYSSLVTPTSVIDYDMDAGTWIVRKQDEIPSGYDPSLYESERVFAIASDGTHIPISLVYKKGLVRDGRNPVLLYGYGSYGFSFDPAFSANHLSLIDRGFIRAIAHIRGGGELGREWYEQGKLLHKRNTFTDFIACAEHLIAMGYTSSDYLAISGRSAGGLLMGAVVTMRPDLWKAVTMHVPFVDVINTMSDPTLPLTVIEYEEWGNPSDKTFYDYMLSYSPYDHVVARAYPHMLVTAGLNDPRVSYWEPAKWVAKLRALKTDNNLLLLNTNTDAGHGGASGRYDYLREIALEYAFLLKVIGTRSGDSEGK